MNAVTTPEVIERFRRAMAATERDEAKIDLYGENRAGRARTVEDLSRFSEPRPYIGIQRSNGLAPDPRSRHPINISKGRLNMKTNKLHRLLRKILSTTILVFGTCGMSTLAASQSAASLDAPAFPTAPIFLSANWSPSAGFGSTAPGWYKEVGFVDPDVVHLQGAAKQTSATGSHPNLLGTLPPAASPDRIVYTIVHTFNGTYADIAIQPNGQIFLINPRPPAIKDYSFVSLEGITYEQFLPVPNPIFVNSANWSHNAGFGSSAPAWYVDGNFYVHLQGAAKQTRATGGNANLLGTISALAGPTTRNVFTIVHTFNGTYADIAIQPNGQIFLINPRLPAVKDYSFASLEGITYLRFGTVNVIPLNKTNWSPNADLRSVPPAWTTADGIVHLLGAAKQTSSTGSNPNLLGTLPLAARPRRNVFTIVHTFSGTYADIAIQSNGQIFLIKPRPPAVKDFTFVSLEGISYQR
jgi:hypothetical protein